MHRFWRITYSREVFNEMHDWKHCMYNGYQPLICSIDQLANAPDTNDDDVATIRNIYAFIDDRNTRDPWKYITSYIEFSDDVDLAFINNYYTARACTIRPPDGRKIILARQAYTGKPAKHSNYFYPSLFNKINFNYY